MRLSLSVVTMLLVGVLGGCGERETKRTVAASFPKPDEVRFQSLERRGGKVCGQVFPGGSENRYLRFIHDDDRAKLDIEVISEYSEDQVAQFEQSCRMLGAANGDVGRDLCGRAREARTHLRAQASFLAAWAKTCS